MAYMVVPKSEPMYDVPYVRPDINFLELAPGKEYTKLPALFSKKFNKMIPPKVILIDPAGNVMHITVRKEEDKIYFADGWKHVVSFYRLYGGVWVHMFYKFIGRFDIKVANNVGDQIVYPLFPEPIFLGDSEQNAISIDDDDDDALPMLVDKSKFEYQTTKWLTFEEVIGSSLRFPKEWCAVALPKKDGAFAIVDEYGKKWSCIITHDIEDPKTCGITSGWSIFCSNKRLMKGQRVEFGVFTPNSNLLYFIPGY